MRFSRGGSGLGCVHIGIENEEGFHRDDCHRTEMPRT
ncbi:hypothetical protein CORC01_03626 [Colletotrichum orchidophilum]|uniref:Uncharacterized protein n=1 Tax=Colletotrichum orchidophilum TaxID=1209926 RepID=A0A1G4BI16_9PEZI|nr:uncharacterized protein CORC01_03626 [Colletotrichum orchidophilum]OHF01059.1 hypothetical protein CORC01_03626 [Colletotrichum orchidophilum]